MPINRIRLTNAIKQLIGVSVLCTQISHAGDTFVVTTDADTSVMGETTLREAIDLATALPGSAVEFDPVFFATPRTISLTQGELLISESMDLIGPGADLLTVDVLNLSRLMTMSNDDPSLIDVNISGITFTGGNGNSKINSGRGGCLHSFENLTLTDSVVTGCSASVDGGGLWHRYGSLQMTGSTIHGNGAGIKGGGMYLRQSTNQLVNSTISGNTATFLGGGIYVDGGIDLRLTTITNNTSHNNLNGGLFVRNNSTNLNKVILSGNNGGEDLESNTNTITAYDSVIGTISVETTVIDSNTLVDADPLLGALTDNGGSTPTHLPTLNSPVVDLGDDSCLGETVDQRGEPRDDGFCDAGSVERVSDLIFKNDFD